MKYFIISTPKSGTYLLSNIYKNMNIRPSNLHIWEKSYGQYNPKTHSFTHHNAFLDKPLSIVQDNEFAVGHIPCNKLNIEFLKDFKKVLIVRDRIELWESAERFILETNRDVTNELTKENLDSIESWQKEDIFTINFQDIISNNVDKIDALQSYLFNEIKFNSKKIIKKSLNDPSLTKSLTRDGKHTEPVKSL